MSYIGNTPTNQNFVAGADQFNGNGSTTAFTLSRNVNTVFDIFVAISNVSQDPYSAYSVSGNTLTFTSAPPSGTGNIYVVYRATNVQTFVPTQGVSPSFGNLTYTGTLTGSTGVINIGSGQVYKDASGNVGIGTTAPGTYGGLVVQAASGIGSPLTLLTTDVGANTQAVFKGSRQYQIGTGNASSGFAGQLFFYDGTAAATRMLIDSTGNLQFNSGYGSVATAYGCRAWVNFNGTGTVAIRASGNVSSITDNGVGLYQVNFTNALVDANFAVVITGGGQGASGSSYAVDAGSATTAKVNIRSRAVSGGAAVDEDPFSVSVFR